LTLLPGFDIFFRALVALTGMRHLIPFFEKYQIEVEK